jgi:predicted nucleic acid-binding protein
MRDGKRSGSSVFVDTGAYAALVIRVDANHHRARETMTELEQRGAVLFTTNFVVAEMYALILARAGRPLAITLLDRLERSSDLIVHVAEENERRAHEIVRRYRDKTFSLVDVMSFAVMERLAGDHRRVHMRSSLRTVSVSGHRPSGMKPVRTIVARSGVSCSN